MVARGTPGLVGAKLKTCPICKKGKLPSKCGRCGHRFKGKPAYCTNKACGIRFEFFTFTCGHSVPTRG